MVADNFSRHSRRFEYSAELLEADFTIVSAKFKELAPVIDKKYGPDSTLDLINYLYAAPDTSKIVQCLDCRAHMFLAVYAMKILLGAKENKIANILDRFYAVQRFAVREDRAMIQSRERTEPSWKKLTDSNVLKTLQNTLAKFGVQYPAPNPILKRTENDFELGAPYRKALQSEESDSGSFDFGHHLV